MDFAQILPAIASAIPAACCRLIFNPKYRTTGTLEIIALFEHFLSKKLEAKSRSLAGQKITWPAVILSIIFGTVHWYRIVEIM
jgi:hypothetical protein